MPSPAQSLHSRPPLTWAGVARRIRVPLSFVFGGLYCWLAHPTWLALIVGSAIVAVGLALRAAASGHIRKDRELTTTGPYAYTRNPLYLGSLLMGLGFAVASRSLWVLALLVLLGIAIYWPLVRAEERYLRANFAGFDEYARRVPRLLPRFTAAQAGGAFSGELYRRHREWQAAIGALAVAAFLIAKILWLQGR